MIILCHIPSMLMVACYHLDNDLFLDSTTGIWIINIIWSSIRRSYTDFFSAPSISTKMHKLEKLLLLGTPGRSPKKRNVFFWALPEPGGEVPWEGLQMDEFVDPFADNNIP